MVEYCSEEFVIEDDVIENIGIEMLLIISGFNELE